MIEDALSSLAVDVVDEAGSTAWVRVDSANWQQAARACHAAGYTYFSYLSAIDWKPNANLNGEKVFAGGEIVADGSPVITDPVTRKGGGATRFQVIANVYDVDRHASVTLVADVDGDEPSIASWTPVYAGADWHERETWEMFGITFEGHPGLRHIYLPAEFEGYPMRKDFALLAREVRPWPGLVDMEEMPEA